MFVLCVRTGKLLGICQNPLNLKPRRPYLLVKYAKLALKLLGLWAAKNYLVDQLSGVRYRRRTLARAVQLIKSNNKMTRCWARGTLLCSPRSQCLGADRRCGTTIVESLEVRPCGQSIKPARSPSHQPLAAYDPQLATTAAIMFGKKKLTPKETTRELKKEVRHNEVRGTRTRGG